MDKAARLNTPRERPFNLNRGLRHSSYAVVDHPRLGLDDEADISYLPNILLEFYAINLIVSRTGIPDHDLRVTMLIGISNHTDQHVSLQCAL